jgi:MFS family permease
MRLPRVTRMLIAGDTIGAFGTGLVLPLTLIYLHQVRAIPLAVVGGLLAMSGAVGLVVVPLTGVLLDRIGARRVLLVTLTALAVAEASLAEVHGVTTAVPALLLLGGTTAMSFPASQTLLAAVNPDPAVQQRAFAVNFTTVNAGIGTGGLVGAAVADVQHPGSFQLLFLGTALSCLVFAAILACLPKPLPVADRAIRADQSGKAAGAKPGYREVLAHRGLRLAMLATLMLAFTGYAAMDSGLPAYATVEAHVSVHVVALSITVNTAVIVGAQLAMLRLVRRLRRSRALALIGLIWAASWAILGTSALPMPHGARIACVFSFTAVFALGEMVMAPTIAPLINSLADDRIRGRANALSSVMYSIAFVISPALSAGLIAAGLPAAWIGLLCAGCLSTVLIGRRLGRQLGREQDRLEPEVTPDSGPVPVPG